MSISPLLEIASSYCLSPRLRTAPTVAHEEHQYSMDLRVAKWGPMPWCMAVFLNCRRCPLWVIAQTEKNSLRANVFRVTPESGHCSMQSACLKGAKRRHCAPARNERGRQLRRPLNRSRRSFVEGSEINWM